jgi:hypothetical protein
VDLLLKDITAQWEELGEKLLLPKRKLREVSVDLFHRGVSRQKSAMLDFWFGYDTEASWKKLSDALEEMDERVLAKRIRKECMGQNN